MPTAKRSPRRTRYSREEAPLGAARERCAGNGQLVRMVKIRMDGPTGLRWVPYAKWWWERNRGPVPAGRRVCHADGNLLNDDPGNLVALTPGEVFKLYHRLDPDMSRRNRAACGRAAAKRNVDAAATRRASTYLPSLWYAVDFGTRTIYGGGPRRKRWQIYRDHGFAERLAARLGERAAAAKAGDTAAASYVMVQTERLPGYWRRIRSASLGWPGVNCMTACVLAAISDAGMPLPTLALRAAVRGMREAYDWRPHGLSRHVLSSCASAAGDDWIRSRRAGRNSAIWEIGPVAIADRISCPRIIPVRGKDLAHPRFAEFARDPGGGNGGFDG